MIHYKIEFKPKALEDCKNFPKDDLRLIFEKIDKLKIDLAGDVKKLTDSAPEYRLRVGNYRILFEIENNCIVIYRILHRKDAYS